MLWTYFTGGSSQSIAVLLMNWAYDAAKKLVPGGNISALANSLFWKVKVIVNAVSAGGKPTWAQLSSILHDVANSIISVMPQTTLVKAVPVAWNLINIL